MSDEPRDDALESAPPPDSSDEDRPVAEDHEPDAARGSRTATRPAPTRPRPRQLPPWKVLLHNDDVHDMLYVVATIRKLTALSLDQAVRRMLEAHQTGVALLLVTHQERAELYQDQFTSTGLTVTIEPDEPE